MPDGAEPLEPSFPAPTLGPDRRPPVTMRHRRRRALTYGPCTQVRGCRRRTLICIIGRVLVVCASEQGAGERAAVRCHWRSAWRCWAWCVRACERAAEDTGAVCRTLLQEHTLTQSVFGRPRRVEVQRDVESATAFARVETLSNGSHGESRVRRAPLRNRSKGRERAERAGQSERERERPCATRVDVHSQQCSSPRRH